MHQRTFGVIVFAVAHFDAWIQTHFERMNELVKSFGNEWLPELLQHPLIRQNMATLGAEVNDMKRAYENLGDINDVGFFPQLP